MSTTKMRIRITAETNKIEWRWIRSCLIVASVINICSLYYSHCFHYFSVKLSHAYILSASEWFARFIGFSSKFVETCVFPCFCHLPFADDDAVCCWCPYYSNLLLSPTMVGFILYTCIMVYMHGCCVKWEWSQTIARGKRYNCTRMSFTLHRPYSQIIIICQ